MIAGAGGVSLAVVWCGVIAEVGTRLLVQYGFIFMVTYASDGTWSWVPDGAALDCWV